MGSPTQGRVLRDGRGPQGHRKIAVHHPSCWGTAGLGFGHITGDRTPLAQGIYCPQGSGPTPWDPPQHPASVSPPRGAAHGTVGTRGSLVQAGTVGAWQGQDVSLGVAGLVRSGSSGKGQSGLMFHSFGHGAVCLELLQLCVSMSVCLCVLVSICPCTSMSLHPRVHLSLHPSTCLSVHPLACALKHPMHQHVSDCPCILMLVHALAHVSVCPGSSASMHLCTHASMHLCTHASHPRLHASVYQCIPVSTCTCDST